MRTIQNVQHTRPAKQVRPTAIFPLQGEPPLRLYTSCAPAYTALTALRGEPVVFVGDDANLSISFREQTGAPLDYGRLLTALKRETATLEAHLIVTGITLEQHERAKALERLGYCVHRIPHPNVDVAVGFVLGRLTARHTKLRSIWALATGDGALGLCLAGALYAALDRPRIVTLSVRHSTALALRQCPLIARNLYLAADLASAQPIHP